MINIQKPFAWYCPKCKKFDVMEEDEQLASPEHVSHRGFDIGSCKEKMIPLYKISQLEFYTLLNNRSD